ncbi:predicted protein [Naegleria gruberi]|uniref:Predicted protein n=1 Tax=Naegleria gruberi TaxID=5762 RepID=D2VTV3_NAEGR|nr:uncharacterized protein NAEGRDRAFT_72438 [Naegleria gruberi]EFC39790.1 predicted protein [Naegleria gruberi]|eukprot:XP_002672534.1 predicted protein [Naegleria gruberi strain NEG-M]
MKNKLPTYWIMAKQWICGLKKNRIDNFVLFVFVDLDELDGSIMKNLKKRIYSSLTDIPVEMIKEEEEMRIIPFTPKEIPQLVIDFMEETRLDQLDKDVEKFYKNFMEQFKEKGENVIQRELFTKHWEFVTLLKPIMVWKCVKKGFNVLFSDLDVVLFQNPTDFMRTYPDTSKFDIIFQIETCGTYESLHRDDIKINTGVYYVKSEPKSIQFLETWMKPILIDILTMFIPVDVSLLDGPNPNGRTEPTNDQAILNALVTKLKKNGNMDFVNSIGYLPVQKFPNKCQYTAIVGPEIDETGKNEMVLFHINGVWMSRQKLNYLKQREHFYLDPNNKCNI